MLERLPVALERCGSSGQLNLGSGTSRVGSLLPGVGLRCGGRMTRTFVKFLGQTIDFFRAQRQPSQRRRTFLFPSLAFGGKLRP